MGPIPRAGLVNGARPSRSHGRGWTRPPMPRECVGPDPPCSGGWGSPHPSTAIDRLGAAPLLDDHAGAGAGGAGGAVGLAGPAAGGADVLAGAGGARGGLVAWGHVAAGAHAARSKIAAMPWPPPMHMVTRARRPPVRLSSYRALTVRMQPVAPMGWPSDTPEPLGLVRSSGRLRSRTTARAWAAKASLTSNTSMSSTLRLAFSSTIRTAGTGPMPMYLGSTPAWA